MPTRGIRLPDSLYSRLHGIHGRWKDNMAWEEKEVDVKLAVDMISMAHRGEYDVAYLLSCDGDYTPAVKEVRNETGRKVFAVLPVREKTTAREGRKKFAESDSSELSNAVDTVIPADPDFFAGLLRQRRRGVRSKITR